MIRNMQKTVLAPLIGLSLLAQVASAAYNPFKPDAIKVTNTTLANSNLAAITDFNNFNTSAVINTNSSVFTSVASDGVNCAPGTYLVDIVLYQEIASSNRTNVSVEATVNGVGTGVIGASAYIRNGDGHGEASAIVSDTITLTTPAKIGFQFQGIARTTPTVAIPVGQSSMRIVRMKD